MVEHHLRNWTRYMRSREAVAGMPRASLGFSMGSQDFEGLCEVADLVAARATDALVCDLEPAQRAAVEHQWLHTVWRFPRNNLDELLMAAYERLAQGMSQRGLV